MSFLSLDTGVTAEYIDLDGDLHREAEAVFRNIAEGRILAFVPHEVLAETYYVSFSIYRKLGLKRPEQRARKLVEWLYQAPNISIPEPSFELAIITGEVKRKFGLALTDSYVLASAKMSGGKALFRKREKEMARRLAELVDEYGVVFLE